MNETEFENFYQEHSGPLWAYLHRLANNPEIADDVLQESFLRFLDRPMKSNDFPKAYLYRIATNLVYDHFRRHRRETDHQNQYEYAAEPAYEPFAGDDFNGILSKLNLQERALLWLAYVEGHRHEEIARMLGLKSLSVRVLLYRAKRKLTKLMGDNNFEVAR